MRRMGRDITRRTLLKSGVALGVGAATDAFAAPSVWVPRQGVKPVVISSGNGYSDLNGGTERGVQRAFRMITSGDDVLDACIACVNLSELDPKDASVGYGGLPNADCVVQLDSCCMHGPKRWAGGVAALEGVRTPSLVAKAVMERTDHHLLVGKGAQDFARAMGFTVEADLNTEYSRKMWQEWKRRIDPEHYLDPLKRERIGHEVGLQMVSEGLIDPLHYYGTINCNGINAKGEICGVTTTSGLSFKIPGRVGDSPILGAGLYIDGGVGAAGSTGRGEANLFNLSSFFIVEEMRRGAHPKDAGIAALKRVAANTTDKRLLNDKGQPNFGMQYYVLDAKGRHAGLNFTPGAKYAVCDENGPRLMDCDALYA